MFMMCVLWGWVSVCVYESILALNMFVHIMGCTLYGIYVSMLACTYGLYGVYKHILGGLVCLFGGYVIILVDEYRWVVCT